MEVITIESAAYQKLIFNIEHNRKLTEALFAKLEAKSTDKYMTPAEVQEYTGFGYDWVYSRKHDIGCFRDGKGLRFKKSAVDKYMEANSHKKK